MKRALAALAIFSVCAAPAFAAPQGLSGAWTGVYGYGEDDTVAFEAVVTDRAGKLTGTTSETNTFGTPNVTTLGATIAGDMDATGLIQFTKTYDGSGGVSHSVRYIGHLNGDGACVVGAWWIGQVSGPFQMCRNHDVVS